MKKFFNILGNIIFAMILIVLVCVIYLNVMYSVNKEKVPSIFGVRMMTVLTGSMRPELEPGDVIFIRESAEIKNEDIVTYKKDNIIITHRVIKVFPQSEGGGFQTKGDNNNVEDGYKIFKKDILGKYLFKVPKLGYIMEFFRSKVGLIIIAVVIGIIAMIEVVKGLTSKKE